MALEKPSEQEVKDYVQYREDSGKMMWIRSQMRESPDPPSELAQDVQPLNRVEFPPEGGILTYMGTINPYPYTGFPFFDFVEKIDITKKVLRGFVSGLYHSLKLRNKFMFLTIIPGFWIVKEFVSAGIYSFHRIVKRVLVKPMAYSTPVREVYRAASLSVEGEKPEFRIMLRDLLCMVLEFDNAYRFRFQDVIAELDKVKLEKHPLRELKRLFDILIGRDTEGGARDTWKLFKLWLSFYLLFDRQTLKIIKNILLNLDLDKVRMSEGDKYWCKKRRDYAFKFMIDQIEKLDPEQNKNLVGLISSLTPEQINSLFRLNFLMERFDQLEARLVHVEKFLEVNFPKPEVKTEVKPEVKVENNKE